MKKAIVFIICLLVVIYATVAVLLLDFNIFGGSSAKADDWMIMQYQLVDNNGDFVADADGNPVLHTKNVPLYINKNTGVKETRAKTTKLESAKLFTYPGHDFDAWWIGGKRYNSGEWLPAGLTGGYLEVLSSWTPKLFQVTFDPMGGSPTPARAWVRHGDTYNHVISANSNITRNNNDFNGWWTTPTGGEYITPDSIVTITENTTFYAHWIPNGGTGITNYTINYYGNGATGGAMASQTESAGSSITLRKNTFTRTNHRFDGWATVATGGIVYGDQSTLSLTKSLNLYAVWSPDYIDNNNYYTISYDANGGNLSAPSSDTVIQNSQIILPYYYGTYYGYTFNGWNTNWSGTGTTYAAGSYYTVSASRTLYAKWEANASQPITETIYYNANGGNLSAPSSDTVVQNSQIVLPYYYGTYNGYTFGGWNTNSSGTGTTYAAGTYYTVSSSRTLYAKWNSTTTNPTTVTVTFDSAGGTHYNPRSVTVGQTYGATQSLPTPTRGTDTFSGWYTAAGTQITNYSYVTISSNHTLIAKWTSSGGSISNPVTVTVSFDSAGGSTRSSMTVTVGQAYGSLGVPVREGYSFVGWFTAAGTQITSSTIVTISSNHTLTAKWTLR